MAKYTALCHVTEMKNPDKSGLITLCQIAVVRMVGLEPTRLAASEPKSGASTNFATSAQVGARIVPERSSLARSIITADYLPLSLSWQQHWPSPW